ADFLAHDSARTGRAGWLHLRGILLHLERDDVESAAGALSQLGEISPEKEEFTSATGLAVALAQRNGPEVERQVQFLLDKGADTGLDADSFGALIPGPTGAALDVDIQRSIVGLLKRIWAFESTVALGLAVNRYLAHVALLSGDPQESLDRFEDVFGRAATEFPIPAPDLASD